MFLNTAKSIALLALAVFLCFGSYLVWTATKAVESLSQQGSSLITHVDNSVTQVNTTLEAVNRPCGSDKPCGTLADLNKTLASVRLASGQVTALSQFERPQLEAINSQELQLFSDTHKVLNGLSDTTNSVNTAVVNLVPLENELDTEAQALQKSTRDFDALIQSPDVSETIHNFNVTSLEFSKTSTDFQTKFHAVLFPPPCKGKFCFLIKSWPYVKAAANLAEPGYWGYELWQAAK